MAERGPGVEQRQLAEHLAGAQDREQVLAAVGGGAAELHLALGDDVELVALVALVEQHLAASQPRLGHRGAQGGGRLVVERAEQRRLAKYVVVHEMSSCIGPPVGLAVGASGHSLSHDPARSAKNTPYDPG